MASHEVVYDVISICDCFIWCRDATIDNCELPILNQSSYLGSLYIILSFPPHFEKLHFSIRKGAIFIFTKFLHNSSENTIDGANVKLKILTLEVILNGTLPS